MADDTGLSAEIIEQFLSSMAVMIERKDYKKGTCQTIDVRPYVDNISLSGKTLQMALRFIKGVTVSPKDVVKALNMTWDSTSHRTKRTQVEWM